MDSGSGYNSWHKRAYDNISDSLYMAMKYEEIRQDVQRLFNKNKNKIKNAEAIPIYLTPIIRELAKYRT